MDEKAQKTIAGGRLKGMTDIKPIWRIEKLTEEFGICGFGWKTKIVNKEIIEGAKGEKVAVVDIELFIKKDGEWSEPIEGTGGSSFVANESSGPYTSDECFKMAYTDALSVACRSLGFGADIYYGNNSGSKYGKDSKDKPNEGTQKITEAQARRIFGIAKGNQTIILQTMMKYGYKNTKDILVKDYDKIVKEIEKDVK